MMINLQLKSSLVWLHGEMVIQDILLDSFHIIMLFPMKSGIDALFMREFCQVVIEIHKFSHRPSNITKMERNLIQYYFF